MLRQDPGELGVYLGLYVATTVTSRTGFTFFRLASQFLYTFLLLLFIKESDRLPVTLTGGLVEIVHLNFVSFLTLQVLMNVIVASATIMYCVTDIQLVQLIFH